MKYYGLHFVGDDNTPIQMRIGMDDQRLEVRTCPKGQWTPWRRLDVMRNFDGSLGETVDETLRAKAADMAARLQRALTITVTGDASGSITFDGSQDVTLHLSIGALGETSSSLADLEKRVKRLEQNSSGGSWSD